MKSKYVTLIFSDTKGKPTKNFRPEKILLGGFCHNERGYLMPLIRYGKKLKRKVVFPPPWISLCKKMNNSKNIKKFDSWSDYIETSNINILDTNPPFTFMDNGDIKTDLKVAYYPVNKQALKNIDDNVDIIILVNCNQSKGKRINSFLPWYVSNKTSKYFKNRFDTNKKLIEYSNKIVEKLNLKNFIFLHIRRNPTLKYWCPPHGCSFYTRPEYIKSYLDKKVFNNNKNIINKNTKIFIATNERNQNYFKELKENLNEYNLIFEEDFKDLLPLDIVNNNYCIYLILHEIAKKSILNIGTTLGYVRLGNKYNYRLCK